LARRILRQKGVIYLRTDDPVYFGQMQETFQDLKDFAMENTPGEISSITTEFERQWLDQGRHIHRAAYRLV
jgi:tRNA G46 methylase TrmB